jgi:hypothetical protein
MAGTDLRQLPRTDQAVLGLGVIALIVSFFPYYGASVNGAGIHASASVNAWNGWALIGILLVFAATAIVAVQVMSPQTLPRMQVSWTFIAAAASVLGLVCVFLRSVTLPSGNGFGVDYGVRFGGWLLIAVCVLHAVVSVMRLRDSGEAMPWAGRGVAPPPSA